MRRLIESVGHECAAVTSLREAVALMHERPFDVVITDLELDSGNSGLDVLEEAKAYHLPCIAFTGSTSQITRQRLLDEGFIEHLFKPFDLVEFEAAIIRVQARQLAGRSAHLTATNGPV